jgi:hypothetical protein
VEHTRALDPPARLALAAGALVGLLAVMWPGVGVGLLAGAAAVVVGLLGAVSPIRVRWRPISGPIGLWVSRMLAPGDRAWHVRADGPELVIVTARRGLRLTVAVPGRGAGGPGRRTRCWFWAPTSRAPVTALRALGVVGVVAASLEHTFGEEALHFVASLTFFSAASRGLFDLLAGLLHRLTGLVDRLGSTFSPAFSAGLLLAAHSESMLRADPAPP